MSASLIHLRRALAALLVIALAAGVAGCDLYSQSLPPKTDAGPDAGDSGADGGADAASDAAADADPPDEGVGG